LAASAVLGVDLGTEYIKATLVKPGIPLEIVLTKDSRRKEMSAVTFKPVKGPQSGSFPERLYGSDAVALAARFPGDVYPNLKTLLGLPADNTVVKEWASRHPALRLEAEKTRGTAAFRSGAFADNEELWSVEEILAMELHAISKNAEALAGKGSRVKDLVITIPAFYTAEEKRAVELAAQLAGLRVLELISDGLAVGINYATTRTFPSVTEGGKPEYHMVFDMGAGSTKATILKFQGRTVKDVGKFNKTVQEVHVLGNGWDRTLGGDALNVVIVDDMITQFVESKGAQKVSATVEGVRAHGRAAAKLWKEAERLRQVLSANTNTQASFEGLYEDVDFRYKISRADFEKLTESHAARVGPAIQKALDMADLTVKDLDSVILHGGAIRTPFVQKELEKIVGKSDKIRSNVNSDEAAVFGAGFRGAGLSPSFRVKEIRAFEGAVYAAGIKWTNLHEKPQHERLWQSTAYLGAEKQYTFKNQKEFSIDFYQHVPSSENVSPGSAEKEVLKITTQNLTESVAVLKEKFSCTDADINLKLNTRLSSTDGEVEITRLILDCEVEDSDKPGMVDSMKNMFGFGKKDQVPLNENGEPLESSTTESSSAETSSTSTTSTSTKSAKDAKSTKETKEAKEVKKATKHFEIIPIKYKAEIKGRPQPPTTEITRMKERLAAFAESDRLRRQREETLNQLEGFTYKARDLLDDPDFVAASTEEERTSLEAKAKDAGEWIYTPEGRDATREQLKTKLKEMKDIVGPIEVRKEEAAGRPEQIKALQDALNQTKTMIVGIEEQIKNDTLKHSSFSASKSSSMTATATPSVASDEFEGLVDDDPSSTISAPIEEETLDPPTYTTADLKLPQSLYDEISAWLTKKLAEQEALPPTADPVILVKDLAAKAKQLQDTQVDLIMKSMKRPQKPKKPTSKPKVGKQKKSKSSSKTASSDKADPTIDFEKFMKVGPDDKLPTEEEILAFMEKQTNEANAADTKAQKDTFNAEDGEKVEKDVDREKEKPHDEL